MGSRPRSRIVGAVAFGPRGDHSHASHRASTRPKSDARLLVAALDGLLLEQLARDETAFEVAVLRPALERLIGALLAPSGP